ncbi:MAG: type II toxin-antitoxin system VapC family toxin [Nitrospirae bacterium]|nr:type II toxin-antitoxin system VapC family toxin [Nitrospirota bacterium]
MIFVDAGALYALADDGDIHHTAAKALHESEIEKASLATSALILTEVWSLIEHRAGIKPAFLWWEAIMASSYELLPVEPFDLTEALKIRKRYRDQNFGLVDCSTFALCEKHRISSVFTFDRKHFSVYRPSFTPRLDLLP